MSSCMKQNDQQTVAKLLMHCNYIEISSVNCLSGIRCLFINTEEGSAKPTTCPGGSLVVVIV